MQTIKQVFFPAVIQENSQIRSSQIQQPFIECLTRLRDSVQPAAVILRNI